MEPIDDVELDRLNARRAALSSQIEQIQGRLHRRDKNFGGHVLTEPEFMKWKRDANRLLEDLRRELREVRVEITRICKTGRQGLYDQIAALRAQLAPLHRLRDTMALHRPALEHLPDVIAALDECAAEPPPA